MKIINVILDQGIIFLFKYFFKRRKIWDNFNFFLRIEAGLGISWRMLEPFAARVFLDRKSAQVGVKLARFVFLVSRLMPRWRMDDSAAWRGWWMERIAHRGEVMGVQPWSSSSSTIPHGNVNRNVDNLLGPSYSHPSQSRCQSSNGWWTRMSLEEFFHFPMESRWDGLAAHPSNARHSRHFQQRHQLDREKVF